MEVFSSPPRSPRSSPSSGPSATQASDDAFAPQELNDRVVIKLLFERAVEIDDVERAWQTWHQRRRAGKTEALWRVLANEPDVDRTLIYAEAARVYAFDPVEIPRHRMLAFLNHVKAEFSDAQWEQMTDMFLLPVGRATDASRAPEPTWVFATHDPSRSQVDNFLETLHLPGFELRYLDESAVEDLIAQAFPRRNEFLERIQKQDVAYDLGTNHDAPDNLVDEDVLEAQISHSALINLFEAMLVEAVREGASDIHIWPNDDRQVEIHFRRDGKLRLWHAEERIHPEAFLAVVKDNALNVDRFERDAAQDGFIQRWIDDTFIRFRVSILPITNAVPNIRAESIVIRILDDRKVIRSLSALGLDALALERFEEALAQPYGMVILTGPTGSGKTTTLYAALQQVATPDINVLTVEDPVEYNLPRVRQIKLNHKLALKDALRSILRHDPDVVMVGEMRDTDTAELAIKLANTGHLTFSTLHTNDAASAVTRLYKMGIEPFLIAYAVNLIVAQRLIRTLCPTCKQVDDTLDTMLLQRLGFTEEQIETTTFYKTRRARCTTCDGSGYKGRRAITEALLCTEAIRHQIVTADGLIDEEALRQTAVAEGMHTLLDSARALVLSGDTSIEALRQVVFTK